jgi:Methyltransferase FkbM domain
MLTVAALILRVPCHTQKTIDYLKMDIEGSEWEVLSSFVRSPEAVNLLRRDVRQVGFEIHTWSMRQQMRVGWTRSGGHPDAKSLKHMLWKLKDFETVLGFRRWSFHFNHHCTYIDKNSNVRSFCYELVYINERFVKQRDLTIDYATSQ